MPNINCLEGIRCPRCGNDERFTVTAVTTVTLTDNGTDDTDGFEFDKDSHAECPECQFEGSWAEFHIDNPPPSISLGMTTVQLWPSPVDEGFTTVQIDTTGAVPLNVVINDGTIFHGDPMRVDNTFEVIRRAALAYLHGDDAPSLITLADALGVAHEDVEGIVQSKEDAEREKGRHVATESFTYLQRTYEGEPDLLASHFEDWAFDYRKGGQWIVLATDAFKDGFNKEAARIVHEERMKR